MARPQRRDGTAAPCERCGAPLSLSHAGRARCLFCLHDQSLPRGVSAPLEEHASLARELDEVRARTVRLARSRFSTLGLFAVIATGVVCAGAGIYRGAIAHEGDALAFAMFASIGVLGLLPFVAIPILWVRVQETARARRLASLPVSTPVVRDERVTSDCPTCGATHPAVVQSLTATCAHCRTEALLPLPLVDARLARLHRDVVDARALGNAEADATKAAVAAWQAMVKPALLGFSAIFFVVLMAFILAAEFR